MHIIAIMIFISKALKNSHVHKFLKLFSTSLDNGVSFSPAGLLTPFHLGASEQLKYYGLLDESTILSGTSGGALAAVTSALNINSTLALDRCCYIARACRDNGTRLTLRVALDDVLNELIPKNSHELLNQRTSPCTVGYMQLYPEIIPRWIKQYISHEDVINVLRASCNIPFYFNGMNPVVNVRNGYGIDGYFSVDPTRFGCPPTYAKKREILISPFSNRITQLHRLSLRQNNQSSSNEPPSVVVISPDLLNDTDWPFSTAEVISMGFGPPLSKNSTISFEKISKSINNRLITFTNALILVIDNASKSLAASLPATMKTYLENMTDITQLMQRFTMELRSSDTVNRTSEDRNENDEDLPYRMYGTDDEIKETYDILFKAGQKAVNIWYEKQKFHLS